MTGLVLAVLLTAASVSVCCVDAGALTSISRDRRWFFSDHSHHHGDTSPSQTRLPRCSECIKCHCNRSDSICQTWGWDCFQYDLNCNAVYGKVTPWTTWYKVYEQCAYQLAAWQRYRSCDKNDCAQDCKEPLVETHYIVIAPCQKANPTSAMTTVTKTTAPTVTKTTAPSFTSAPAPHQCEKLCAITAVANGNGYQLATAPACPDTTHRSPEAMIEQCCTTFGPVTWKKGANVMGGCSRTAHYAPVGRFDYGFYQPGSAGIFLECSQDGTTGFMMALQTCNDPPTLRHVTNNGTTKLGHPELYYFIV